jgi:hypothetical protein
MVFIQRAPEDLRHGGPETLSHPRAICLYQNSLNRDSSSAPLELYRSLSELVAYGALQGHEGQSCQL